MLGCRVIWLSILSKRRVALVREGDVRLCDSQFFKTRANPHRKPGMSKVAYHRMLVGGLEVVKRAKRWNTIGPSQKQQPLKLACAQCSVAAWHGRGSTKFCFACNITPIQTGGCLRMQRGRWGWSIGKILTPPPPQNHPNTHKHGIGEASTMCARARNVKIPPHPTPKPPPRKHGKTKGGDTAGHQKFTKACWN